MRDRAPGAKEYQIPHLELNAMSLDKNKNRLVF